MHIIDNLKYKTGPKTGEWSEATNLRVTASDLGFGNWDLGSKLNPNPQPLILKVLCVFARD